MSIAARRLQQAAALAKMSLYPTAVTFTPAVIPLSDPEIPNSGRGQYYWLNQPAA